MVILRTPDMRDIEPGESGREIMRLYWFRGSVHNILLLYFIAAGVVSKIHISTLEIIHINKPLKIIPVIRVTIC